MEVWLMRIRKSLLSLHLCVLFLFSVAGYAWAAPVWVYNWGNVSGDVDVTPVVLYADSYYAPMEAQTELEFTVVGLGSQDPGYFTWGSPLDGDAFSAIIFRTTLVSGDLDGAAWYSGGDEIGLVLEKDPEISGEFSASFNYPFDGLGNNESCDASFSWDFSLEEGRLMTGTLHATEYNDILNGDTASCDVGVVLLSDTPAFDVFVGKYDFNNPGEEMKHARSLGPVGSTEGYLDAGLLFLLSGDSLGIIYANFWDEQIELSADAPGLSPICPLFAPDLYGADGPPSMLEVDDYYIIDPALALEGYIASLEDQFTDINFVDGTTTHISWLWCIPLVEEGPTAAGLIAYPPTSADVNDVLDPDVAKVLDPDDLGRVSSSFTLVGDAEPGEYIGLISMDIDIPENFEGEVLALPIGLRIGIDPGEVEEYDPELVDTIEAEIGDDPSEEEMEAAIRKYYSFVKEWSTGEAFQIRLDDEDFRDAVDIFFEYDGDGVVDTILFTVNLLIVDGGNAGEVDSVTVDGRTYIVIYDGNNDEKFADPIKIVAATEESVGNSGGGCSSIGLFPFAGLLLLPLLMIFRN